MFDISKNPQQNSSFPIVGYNLKQMSVTSVPESHNESEYNQCLDCNLFSQDSFRIVKSVILGIIVCLTICGNVLVLLAVIISRNLRSSTHYLIVNLAVADLLLGTTVLPFSATFEVSHIWYFGQVFCEIWAAVDVLCCTASIWSLCVISLDRYIGVTRPLAYSTIMTEKRVCVLIGAVWVLSIAISIGPAFGWKTPPSPDPKVCSVNEELGYVLFSVIGSFYLPGICIILVYWRIYKEAYRQSKFLESGTKTTSSEVTLRVHTGGNATRRDSSPRLTLRAHRGGYYSPSPISSETSVTLNDTVLTHRNETSSNEGRSASPEPLRYSRGRNSDSSKSNFHLPLSSGEQWTHLQPEDAVNIFNRKFSGDSQASTPERRISGIHGRLVKFRRQKKAAKTLGIVVGVFLLCWFPFFFVLPLVSLCSVCRLPDAVFAAFFWLGYFNSCLNPFIYASTSREFKRAFQRILCHHRWLRNNQSLTPAFSFTSSFRKSPKGLGNFFTNSSPQNEPCVKTWDSSSRTSAHSSRSCSYECEIKEIGGTN